MDMKLVHNNGAWQNRHAQRAALTDTIYSCLASNRMKYINNVRKYPPFGNTRTHSISTDLQSPNTNRSIPENFVKLYSHSIRSACGSTENDNEKLKVGYFKS